MTKNSPHYLFRTHSLGWLKLRARNDRHVSPEDLAIIIEVEPELVPDPVLRLHVIQACRGQLTKKRGRRATPRSELRLMFAQALSDELVERFSARKERWKKHRITRPRGDLSPTDRAHDVVARILRFSSLETVRNALSSRKKRLNSRV